MECKVIRAQLPLYMDNMLDESLMEEVESHLAVCDACKKEYEELTSLTLLLNRIPDVKLPEEFEQRLHKALVAIDEDVREENRVLVPLKSKTAKWRKLSAVAAIFVVGIFAIAMYNNNDQMMPSVDSFSNMESSQSEIEKDINKENANDEENVDEQETAIDRSAENLKQDSYKGAPTQNAVGFRNSDGKDNSLALAESDTLGAVADLPVQASPVRGNDFYKSYCSYGGVCQGNITGAGINSAKDSVALGYYMKTLEREIGSDDFEVMSIKQEQDGKWYFEVQTSTKNQYGEQQNVTVTYVGQDGTLWMEE